MSQKMLLVVCCTAALCSLGALWGCSESGTSPDNRDIMTLSTSSLEFTAWAGTNPNPAQQKVLVRIGGEGGANWTVSSPAFWLRLGPTGSDTIFVSVISIDLPIGIYRDTIVVQSLDASNSPVLLPVVLNVLNRLALTPQFLDFAALTGGSPPDTQTFLVADFAGNAVPYTATTAVDWIRLTNASGTTPETVSVIVDQTGLESGQYRDSIVVTSTELSESRVSLVCRLNISSWAAQDLGPGGSSINLESVGFVDPLTGWISGWLPSSADEPHDQWWCCLE